MPLWDDSPLKLPKLPIVTWGLIVANVVVFAFTAAAAPDMQPAILNFAVTPANITAAPIDPTPIPPDLTLVSYMFLHANLWHLLGNVIFLSSMELILLPLFAVFYNLRLWEGGGWLVLIVFLGSWGLAAVGTSFAAIATSVRLRELMLPVLLFPIEIPLLLSLVQATTAVVRGGDSMADLGIWLRLCFGFDVIFTTLSLYLFEYVLEA